MELNFLNLFAVLLAAWLAGWAARRVGYPSVLGELIVGVLLGPPLLGLLHASDVLLVLAELGVLLMMLYIGMEIDPREISRASWSGLIASIGGFATPFVLVFFAVRALGGTDIVGLFAGITAGVTALAVNSRILLDLRLLDTRIAHVMMAGALVADILSLLVFAAISGVVEMGQLELLGLATVIIKAIAFFGLTFLVGSRVFPYLGRLLTDAGLTGRTFHFTLALIIAVLFGELAEVAGLHAILGAFIAGMFLRDNVLGKSLSHELMGAVKDISIGFLTPIFFVTAGFAVSFGIFSTHLTLFLVVLVIAVVGKTLGTMIFYLPSRNGWREGLVIGAGMNGRGGVDIIIAGIALKSDLISADVFSVLVFVALLTTLMVPGTLKGGIGWLRRRGELVQSGDRRQGTIIVGAGPLARAMGRALLRSQPVRMIDRNEHHCIVSESEGLETTRGNALQEQVLSEARASEAESIIALTPNGEVNSLVVQLAGSVFSVPEIYLLGSGQPTEERSDVLRHLGAKNLFSGPVTLEEWDFWLSHGKASARVFSVDEDQSADQFLNVLAAEGNACLPLARIREGAASPFLTDEELKTGDEVAVVCRDVDPVTQRDRFDELAESCPVLDIRRSQSAEDFFATVSGILAPRLDTDEETLCRQFLRSEMWSSTVIAPGLAIPHLLITGDHPLQMVIARCREGVAFPDQDDAIHAVFVLVSTRNERNFHLRALSAIAQIVQQERFEERWMTAPDAEDLRRLILRADRRRG